LDRGNNSDGAALMSAPRSRRMASGFVLVAVLWMLAALATLASIYSAYTSATAAGSHVSDDRLQAEASIRAGIEMAAFEQLAVPEPARPSQGSFSLRVGHTSVIVRFRSEAARIDLNVAPTDVLEGLFTVVGVDPANAKTFADRVIGWRSKAATNADSREAKLYAEWRVPYPPRQAPFEDPLELSLLPGLSASVVRRVLPFVTVFSGRPTVDVATADPAVLLALPGMTPEVLAAVLKARANPSSDERDLLSLLGPAKSRASVERSKALRAEIDVAFDNGRRVRAEVVFRLNETGEEPYGLLFWRDDFDGPMPSA
jgi:general secretion pathway protein K